MLKVVSKCKLPANSFLNKIYIFRGVERGEWVGRVMIRMIRLKALAESLSIGTRFITHGPILVKMFKTDYPGNGKRQNPILLVGRDPSSTFQSHVAL